MPAFKFISQRQIISSSFRSLKICFKVSRTCQTRACSSQYEPSTTSNIPDNLKSFVPFQQIVDSRRDEAARSFIIQIKASDSCDELMRYCTNFGPTNKSFFYSVDHLHNFLIVEFKNHESTKAVLEQATHSSEIDIIPVTSSFLYFRKSHSKGEVLPNSNYNIVCENSKLPSKLELARLLSESNNFNDDSVLLYQRLKLTETGSRLRFMVAMQLENALKGLFRSCRVLPFGSSINRFGKMNCDLDLVLDFKAELADSKISRLAFLSKSIPGLSRGSNQRPLEEIADIMQYFLPGCSHIRRILRARVPIVKYKHDITALDCDLSCLNLSGVYMSELLYLFSSYDERVCPLVFTVRYWAKEFNLTQSNPGKWITNFSLTLLVLFFLQKEKIIPTLNTLSRQKRPKDLKIIDTENIGFLTDLKILKNPGTIRNTDSLMILLIKFFQFYSLLDFRKCALSLNSGTCISKPTYDPLYIVNPLEPGLNVSRNVSSEECERLRLEVKLAAEIIERSINGETENSKWGLVDFLDSRARNKNEIILQTIGMKTTPKVIVRNVIDDAFKN